MKIYENVNLKGYNTFMLPSIARYFVEIKSVEDIIELINSDIYKNASKKYFLGEGANTIFVDDFDGLVIKIEITGKEKSEIDDGILIKVGAGEIRYDFVSECTNDNYVGMENLAYIPSSIGASAVQNIGAYGVEAKDIIYEVEGIDLTTGETKIYKNSECNFDYRGSIFKDVLKDNFLITYVTYKLQKFKEGYVFNCKYDGISEKISELGFDMDSIKPIDFVKVITEIRKGKLPDRHETGTAGSFFKNPIITTEQWNGLQSKFPELKGFEVTNGIKLSAGQLIDMCGFKGKGNGKVGTYKTHALILVNEGDATGSDVSEFAKEIQDSVKSKFGVNLDPEAIFVE